MSDSPLKLCYCKLTITRTDVYGRILMLLEQLESNVRTCTIFRHGLYIMIISQICRNGKDCGQIGDRMSDNYE